MNWRLSKLVFGGRRGDLGKTLVHILGKRTMAAALSQCNDKRHIVSVAARISGREELQLLVEVARRMGMRVLKEVPPITPEANKGRYNLAQLRRMAAVPLFKEDRLIAFACLDPRALLELIPEAQTLPVFISSWFSLARALDLSEQSALQQREEASTRAAARQRAIAAGVANLVMQEARNYGASQVIFNIADGQGVYEFTDANGRRARGGFEAQVWKHLLEHIQSEWAQEYTVRLVEQGRISVALPAAAPCATSARQKSASDAKVAVFPSVATAAQELTDDAPRIMVVDDNPSFCSVLERFFSRDGFEVTRSHSCEDALEKLERRVVTPHLIISDLHLPGMNGLQFLERVRALHSCRDTPLLILTSDDDVEAELKLLSAGADLFLPKTVDPRVLRLHARRLIGGSAKGFKGAA